MGRKVQGKRGETEEQDGALQNTVADWGIAAPQNDAAALPEDAAGAALYPCPWPGCDRQFQRVKSRSAHLKWHGGDYTEAAGPAATVASPTEAVSPARVAAAATAAVMPTSGPTGGGEEKTSTRRGKQRKSDPLHALADATDHREDATWLVAGAAVLCRQCAPVDNGGAVRYASGTLLAPVLPAGGAPEPVAWTVRFGGGRGGKRASETAVADIFPDVVPEPQQASVCTARPVVALPGALSGTLGPPTGRSAFNLEHDCAEITHPARLFRLSLRVQLVVGDAVCVSRGNVAVFWPAVITRLAPTRARVRFEGEGATLAWTKARDIRLLTPAEDV